MNSVTDILLQFLILPIILPFLIGLIILFLFRKDAASRLIGMLALKPVIAFPIWYLYYLPNWSNGNYSNIVISLIPAVLLTLGIVLLNRKVFDKSRIPAAIFLGLDLLRMLNTLVMWTDLGDETPMPVLFYFGLALPSLIAVTALIFVIARRVSPSRRQTQPANAVR